MNLLDTVVDCFSLKPWFTNQILKAIRLLKPNFINKGHLSCTMKILRNNLVWVELHKQKWFMEKLCASDCSKSGKTTHWKHSLSAIFQETCFFEMVLNMALNFHDIMKYIEFFYCFACNESAGIVVNNEKIFVRKINFVN